jgi:cation-dependent mannose-6-phosphate receptor
MKLSAVAFLLLSSLTSSTHAASDSSRLHEDTPCVARSPSSGLYFDLRAISLFPPELKDGEKIDQNARNESWYCKGYDYPANFSINVCEPVIEPLRDVVGVDSSRWKNISAYYEQDGQIYSLGYGGVPAGVVGKG